MSDTSRYAMPLLDAAQAQKHVTVNEALLRADALGARVAEDKGLTVPPVGPADGTAWIVGAAATGDWAGQDDAIALFLNGGWVFVAPWPGLAFWVAASGVRTVWSGSAWLDGLVAASPGAAATVQRVVDIDHTLAAGASSVTAAVIPDKAVVLGVTGKVTTAITGATGWSLGVPGAIDRYGTGYGAAMGSYAHGVSGQPLAYYGGTALEVTAEGGSFTGGAVRLAVHFQEIVPPA